LILGCAEKKKKIFRFWFKEWYSNLNFKYLQTEFELDFKIRENWFQNLLRRFLAVWPENLLWWFSPVWPQNWWRRFLSVWPQNQWSVSWLSLKTKVVEGFPVWASKPTALVWWFVPQNHRDSFLICASKPSELQFVGCATKPTDGGRHGTRVKI
jgi:hypothetical protein